MLLNKCLHRKLMLVGIIVARSTAHGITYSIPASTFPQCSDLVDNTETFNVTNQQGTRARPCSWVDRDTDTRWKWSRWKWKCRNSVVQENCPVRCRVPCKAKLCEDLEDNTERFYVEGRTLGTGMKTCKWANKINPIQRCKIGAVQTNCPVLCRVPCEHKSESPSASPSISSAPSLSMKPSDPPSEIPSSGPSKPIMPSGTPSTSASTSISQEPTPSKMSDSTSLSASPSVSSRPSASPSISSAPSLSLIPSDPPSEIPSSDPSKTTMPSGTPSTTDFCEDLEDKTGRFYVEGTQGTGMRTCRWAKNINTRQRCKMDSVRVNCPVLCGIPCEFKSESPSKSPAYKDSEISQSNTVPAPKETSLRIIITLSILCGVIVAVIIAASFGYSIQKTDGNFAESTRTRKTDDDFVEDKPKSAVHVVHTPISFKGSPSCVPSDRCNLGLVHSAQDVQCCQNCPCDVCRTYVLVDRYLNAGDISGAVTLVQDMLNQNHKVLPPYPHNPSQSHSRVFNRPGKI
jgi:hypothetical protein